MLVCKVLHNTKVLGSNQNFREVYLKPHKNNTELIIISYHIKWRESKSKMVKEDLTAREQFQLKDTLDVFQTKMKL